jgi:hypothetical protein
MRIFSMCGGMKWIIRSSRTGRSRNGGGAPAASGRKKFRGVRVCPIQIQPFSQGAFQAADKMTGGKRKANFTPSYCQSVQKS